MIYDILIFGGQSNMQGETEGAPEVNLSVEGALEYRFLTDTLKPLDHPVGETIEKDILLPPLNGCATLLPDCCRTYIEHTSRNVVAVHAARGATTIAEWMKGTRRYEVALKKIRSCIEKVKEIGEIGKIYYIWLQGESDSIQRTSTAEYMERLTQYKNDLKADCGIDQFCLIEVGYFTRTVRWLSERTFEDRLKTDEAIMRAQETLPTEDPDFVMLTQICKKISLQEEYINPFVDGHYNTLAMQYIGKESGKALAELANRSIL